MPPSNADAGLECSPREGNNASRCCFSLFSSLFLSSLLAWSRRVTLLCRCPQEEGATVAWTKQGACQAAIALPDSATVPTEREHPHTAASTTRNAKPPDKEGAKAAKRCPRVSNRPRTESAAENVFLPGDASARRCRHARHAVPWLTRVGPMTPGRRRRRRRRRGRADKHGARQAGGSRDHHHAASHIGTHMLRHVHASAAATDQCERGVADALSIPTRQLPLRLEPCLLERLDFGCGIRPCIAVEVSSTVHRRETTHRSTICVHMPHGTQCAIHALTG